MVKKYKGKRIKGSSMKPTIKVVRVRLGKGRYAIIKVKNMAQFNRDIRRLKKKYK